VIAVVETDALTPELPGVSSPAGRECRGPL